MKIVIDIPDEDYVSIKSGRFYIGGSRGNGKTITGNLLMSICNGTPLPEGHGRLALVEIPYGINGCNSCPMHERVWCCVTNECDVAHEEMSVIGRHNCCPVIEVIEADKEGAEE